MVIVVVASRKDAASTAVKTADEDLKFLVNMMEMSEMVELVFKTEFSSILSRWRRECGDLTDFLDNKTALPPPPPPPPPPARPNCVETSLRPLKGLWVANAVKGSSRVVEDDNRADGEVGR